jgi:hypothetical protein
LTGISLPQVEQNPVFEVVAMSYPLLITPMRRAIFVAVALLFAASFAVAQSAASQDQSGTVGYSSSQAEPSASGLQLNEFSLPNESVLGTPASDGAGAGQYGNGGGYGGSGKHGLLHNWAFEAGGGFNAPQSNSVTYGGQFTVGAGLNFSKRIAGLIEYQFLDDKLPGYLISETGASGGFAHIWSFTFDPVIDLMPKATNDVYITGGGGFYRKVTSFTDPEETEYCDYYYGYCGVGTTNVVVGHFSSNQGGWNVGAGFQHRMGGTYGDGKTKLFIEARYLEVLTPAVKGITPNGLNETTVAADTKVIPVSVGLRF